MIKQQLKKYHQDFNNYLKDLKSIKTWYKQLPNLLTISRPIGMIPANILFFTGNVIPAVILTGCLLLTDLFDGKLARKWHVESKLGADLDALGDKIMFLGMSLPLVVTNPLIIINILLEGAISFVNVSGRLQGMDTKTIYTGKLKTWFLSLLLLMGYITQFFSIPKVIFDIIMVVTCVSQGITLNDYINEYQTMKQLSNKKIVNDCQDVTTQKDDKKLVSESHNLIEQLTNEKEFLLATKEPSKLSQPKKRILFQRKQGS